MDYDIDPRPTKKRRFFCEIPEDPDPAGPSSGELPESSNHDRDVFAGPGHDQPAGNGPCGFDSQLLENFVGERLSEDVMQKLRQIAGDNVELAINAYFDGSWKGPAPAAPTSIPQFPSFPQKHRSASRSPPPSSHRPQEQATQNAKHTDQPVARSSMPDKRYIGAFGAACWAIRSGTNLIKHGDKVNIERSKLQATSKMGRGRKIVATSRRSDNIVRFTNSRREEVGRLEQETAAWVAPLMDQNLCSFEGRCVFAPDRVRSNDTIFLQVHAFFNTRAFEARGIIKPMDSNRATGIHEAKETQDERDLHLRQMGLIRLFNEISLHPSKTNSSTEKHKRQGLLQATDVADRYDENKASTQSKPAENGGSSPPSEEAEEGQELEEDQLDSLYKKAQTFDFDTPEMEAADTFIMDLRPYQKQALHWMVGKERDEKSENHEVSMHPLWEEYEWPVKDVEDQDLPLVEGISKFYVNPYSGELSLDFPLQEQNCLGGILADEMGLGKTIEMLGLMHSQRSEVSQRISDERKSDVNSLPRLPSSTSTTVEQAPCTTLVVAPLSLIGQWQSEAEKASKPGTLRTLLYYGDKSVNLKNLCCIANAANAPNLIITSYGSILSEYTQIASQGGDRRSHGGLFSLDYYRVILDEAHHVKNRQSKTAKACYDIHAKHRWVLTGTPIVNRLEDLFSLVHFLRVEPWSNFSFWKTFITVPFESGDYVKALDVVQTVLEPLVLRRTKDMKTPDGKALVPLPPRTIDIERVELSKDEREVYNLIFKRAKRTFSANVEAGTLMKSYTTIFAQILRLRQSCCHPILTRNKDITADEEDAAAAADAANGLADDMDLQALIERFTAEQDEQDASRFGAHALRQIQEEAESECPICAEEPMIEPTVTGCWHSACKKCLVDYIDRQRDGGDLPRCFNCREAISARDIFEVVRHDDGDDDDDERDGPPPSNARPVSLRRLNQPSSAKITALLNHLRSIRRAQPAAKSVIFSQFTSFLDLLEPALRHARIPFLRFDGSTAHKARAAVLSRFARDDARSDRGAVLLLSLRAGGVGLNLTAASRVFVMDPWWSWAVEAQAIDRVHRMGQPREVKVVRFVCGDSIEEKMLRIQERKKFLAGSLGMMGEEERRRGRIEDIGELLS